MRKYSVIVRQIEVSWRRKIRNALARIFLITKTYFMNGLKSLSMAHVAEFRQSPVEIVKRQTKENVSPLKTAFLCKCK